MSYREAHERGLIAPEKPQAPAASRVTKGFGAERPRKVMTYGGEYPDLPASSWNERRAEQFAHLLAAGEYETLVAPVTNHAQPLDFPTRHAMGLSLSRALARTEGSTLPDMAMVERALGGAPRMIDVDRVRKLATAIGARRIVYPSVEYTLTNGLKFAVRQEFRQDNGSWRERDDADRERLWSNMSIEDGVTPYGHFLRRSEKSSRT